KSRAIGVVLTGSGSDGTAGLKAIKEQGGITFAQTEETAEFSSMPNSAVQEGIVDFIFPPNDIPGKILEVINGIYGKEPEDQIENENIDIYRQILALLRIRKGADFTYYKQTTIRRRILRRVELNDINDPEEYLKFIRENKQEQDALQQDLLIPVTEFFRDREIFANLCDNVIPQILETKKDDEFTRIWVAACSTGQEVYSIAICLLEAMEKTGSLEKVQIFGTDISEPSIAKARAGIYTEAEMENITPERRSRFFKRVEDRYQIKKEIREMCIFSLHNFLKDPPFGKMDLISCRNVLIYLQPYLQKKVFSTFHFALRKSGYLLLGKSETAGNVPDLFDSTDKKLKIYTPRDKPRKFMQVTTRQKEENYREFGKIIKEENARTDFERVADDVILNKYTPAGVVVDDDMEIVHFRGRTGNYLEQQAGKPNLNLLRMAKPGLAFELRSVVHYARKKGESVLRENIPIQVKESQRLIGIEAIPLPNLTESYYLILFHDQTLPSGASVNYGNLTQPSPRSKSSDVDKNLIIKQLEKELAQSREDMRSITEDQEATNEELQSANEELQSGSEELQTLNEELETSKEELQSTNEELISLNQELLGINKNLKAARNFAVDIMETIREPWVVLDKDLRVKSANKAFYRVFRTSREEIQDQSVLTLGNNQRHFPELESLLHKVLSEKTIISDYEITQDFPFIGERTMLINAREVKREEGGEQLILLVFGDITDKRIAEKSLEKSEIKFKLLADTIPQLIWISNAVGKFEYFNSKWRQFTGLEAGEDLNSTWASFVHEDDLERVLTNWNECLKTGNAFSMEYRLKSKEGTYNWFLVKALPLFSTDGEIIKWFGSYTNIENQKEAETALLKSREHFRRLAELVPGKISQADANGRVKYFNKSWIDYTGLSRKDLLDFTWEQVLHDEDREKAKEKWAACVATGQPFEMELRILDRKGEYKWHLSRSIPVLDEAGNVQQWIGATTEIEKIKEEEKRKEGFLQLVSHELKTPITSIKGYVQLLLSLLQHENDPVLEKLPLRPSLSRIDDQIARLTRLISEMLDLSRIEENKLELKKEHFSLNELVTATVEDINRTKIEHRIRIDNKVNFNIEADKDRIEQVIINLVMNAIKYSPVNKGIEVLIYETEDNKAAVSITDHGIGIAEGDLEHIFKRFHRVAGRSEETYAGLGIGLFLAHEIVGRHGGRLTVESTLGEGSVFTFSLPYKEKGES
ncbi:MAG TPA: CheR family methyltransferase, partial [Gillisia sp.]|nr:CheR family methyltransferase [Gillisia sp.]